MTHVSNNLSLRTPPIWLQAFSTNSKFWFSVAACRLQEANQYSYIIICFSLITPNPDTMQIQYNSLPMYFQYIDGFNMFQYLQHAHVRTHIYITEQAHTHIHAHIYIHTAHTYVYIYIYYIYIYPINPYNAHIEKCKRVCLRSPSFIVSCPRHQLPAALILEDDFDLQPDFAFGSWGWSCGVLIWYIYMIYPETWKYHELSRELENDRWGYLEISG